MSSSTNVSALLEKLGVPVQNLKAAEECLSQFVALGKEEKEAARPAIIEKAFPLIFGEEAAIEGSANFKEFKQSPW